MHSAHGIGYAEYNRSLDKRMEIEKAREEDYKRCNQIAKEFNQQHA
ncbi:hypothetical protein RYX56_07275 [Alkalihalophilus lindianensis]|uniref:Uncharacterized protein n=1 Tax=Alkalihalophilus lindianensis TaxID=1630542 RepID=A0ABU3X8F1_9BACI|nr:hypothetical protein [Alkalihalophilus lindianensis]MDV2684166.1 hypothetical protein [Alkalihalophilus lindianensis]